VEFDDAYRCGFVEDDRDIVAVDATVARQPLFEPGTNRFDGKARCFRSDSIVAISSRSIHFDLIRRRDAGPMILFRMIYCRSTSRNQMSPG
jgi:hypothetical protein